MTILFHLIKHLGESLNSLNTTFFSTENVESIQVSIPKNVSNFSIEKFNIGRQSDQELYIAMREIYRQYAEYPQVNSIENIQKEVHRLNDILTEKAVVGIIKKIRSHQKYLSDRTRGYALQNPPIFDNSKGEKLGNPMSENNKNNIGINQNYPW